MDITILYGTESGNSELIAEDLANHLVTTEHTAEVFDLQDFAPQDFNPAKFYLVICSTHGEGDLPHTAIPFAAAFDEAQPDMTGIRYAMFGLGDSFYEETYSQGSEHIDRRFSAQGARRIGEYGRHDASSWDLGSDVAIAWLQTLLAEIEA